MLKQLQYKPMKVAHQVIVLFAATKKYLMDIALSDILDFEAKLIEYIDTKYPELEKEILVKTV